MKKKLTKEQRLRKQIKELKREISEWSCGVITRKEELDKIKELREKISIQRQEIERLIKSRDNEIYLRGRIEGMREVLGYEEGTPEAGSKDIYYGEEEYDKRDF